jgi:hypothetical protein
MMQIILEEKIPVPRNVVWDVICNTRDYPSWNKFVVACHSSFEVGTPIVMSVKVLPFIAMRQKESIRQNIKGELLEYGIKIPLGILSSSRQHILTSIDANTTKYESVFILNGALAPIVDILLGHQLKRGFSDMTNGIVIQAKKLNALKS